MRESADAIHTRWIRERLGKVNDGPVPTTANGAAEEKSEAVGAGEDADTGAGGGGGDAVADQEARERSILANAVQEEEAWSAGFRLRHEW